ncbi:MAG TPA: hypothetical protein EYH09_00915 [Candidatus Nanopusillus sp.]|nr:hypothetical protein [Candidatus Nanopusillus sp.]
MYKRFCVLCGKEDIKLVNGLCRECYGKVANTVKKKLKVRLKLCTICGKLQYKNKWYCKDDLLLRLERDLNLKIKDIIIRKKEAEIVSDTDIDVELEKIVCTQCIRYLNKSYQYIIQIRGDPLKSKDLVSKLIKMDIIIKQIKESKYGYDLYLCMNPKTFKRVLSILKSKRYDILISRKLVTFDKQKGKNKYRVTIRVKI